MINVLKVSMEMARFSMERLEGNGSTHLHIQTVVPLLAATPKSSIDQEARRTHLTLSVSFNGSERGERGPIFANKQRYCLEITDLSVYDCRLLSPESCEPWATTVPNFVLYIQRVIKCWIAGTIIDRAHAHVGSVIKISKRRGTFRLIKFPLARDSKEEKYVG